MAVNWLAVPLVAHSLSLATPGSLHQGTVRVTPVLTSVMFNRRCEILTLYVCLQTGTCWAFAAHFTGWLAAVLATGNAMAPPNIAWLIDRCRFPEYAACCKYGHVIEGLRYAPASSLSTSLIIEEDESEAGLMFHTQIPSQCGYDLLLATEV